MKALLTALIVLMGAGAHAITLRPTSDIVVDTPGGWRYRYEDCSLIIDGPLRYPDMAVFKKNVGYTGEITFKPYIKIYDYNGGMSLPHRAYAGGIHFQGKAPNGQVLSLRLTCQDYRFHAPGRQLPEQLDRNDADALTEMLSEHFQIEEK